MRIFGKFVGMLALIGATLFFGIGSVAAQQSFSCPYGKKASCLDYNDKVCSYNAKCVDQNAKCVDQSSTCFSSYTCNFQGFICKSKYDEVVDDYNDLLRNNKRLVSEYDDLLRKNKRLVSEYNSLLLEHRENVNDYNALLSEHSELESCISFADSLEAAKRCAW